MVAKYGLEQGNWASDRVVGTHGRGRMERDLDGYGGVLESGSV